MITIWAVRTIAVVRPRLYSRARAHNVANGTREFLIGVLDGISQRENTHQKIRADGVPAQFQCLPDPEAPLCHPSL